MATETGIVIKTGPSGAHVRTVKSSACKACAARDGCHTLGGGKEMEAEAVNTVGAKVGDEVIISFENASLVKASFLVYIVPILGLIAGAVIGQEIAPDYGLNPSGLSAVIGFLFFFLVFMGVRQIGNRWANEEKYRPRVIRIKKRGSAVKDMQPANIEQKADSDPLRNEML